MRLLVRSVRSTIWPIYYDYIDLASYADMLRTVGTPNDEGTELQSHTWRLPRGNGARFSCWVLLYCY